MFGWDLLLDMGDRGNQEDATQMKICGIAQDIVYGLSTQNKLTPKHLALGSAQHQATRSEALVTLFHAAGHNVEIDTVRRADTTIANDKSI